MKPTETDDSGDLAGETTRGVLWTVVQKWSMRIGGFLTVAILTRLLSPQDFGVLAVALTVLPVLYLLSDFGFATYVVQATDVDERLLSTAFWYSAASGLVLATILGLLANPVGHLLKIDGLSAVLWGCAPVVICVTFSSVSQALLKRRMAFRALALQAVVAAVAGQVAAIALAIAGMGVWALVGQLIVSEFVAAVAVCVAAGWLPKLVFSRQEFKKLAGFGTKVVGVDAVSLLRSWGETAVIGSVIGVAGLGYLRISQRLIQVTQDLSAAAILPVSTVAFARVRQDSERLRRAYLRATSVSYAVVAPALVLVAVGAPVLVPLVFGSEWNDSILPAQALAIAGILTLGAMLDHALFLGSGRPGTWLVYATVIDALTLGTTAAVAHLGLAAVSFGFVGVALVATIARWWLVARLVGTSPWELALGFGRFGIVAGGSGVVGLLAMHVTEGLPSLVRLAVVGLAVLAVHVGLMRSLMADAYETLDVQLRRRVFTKLGLRPRVA